jgi:iron-sulfur cluster assembly accessory protein
MPEGFSVTDRAASRIREIIASEPEKVALRIQVLGGGCSGFQYDIGLTDTRDDDDLAVTREGATVVIDSTSLVYLLGSELDYEDGLIGAQFRIRNPNATASCGCGTSFSV